MARSALPRFVFGDSPAAEAARASRSQRAHGHEEALPGVGAVGAGPCTHLHLRVSIAVSPFLLRRPWIFTPPTAPWPLRPTTPRPVRVHNLMVQV